VKRAVVGCVLLLVTACGVRPSGVIAGGAAPEGPILAPVVFFLVGDSLAPAVRRSEGVDSLLGWLTAGPTMRERQEGLRSEVPSGVTLREEVRDGRRVITASVDPRTLSPLALEQIVCTVAFAVDGAGPVIIAGESVTLPPRWCGDQRSRPAEELPTGRVAPR